jgi:hypothetical protein
MKTFRRWLANTLARWARRIYPQSEEVMAFWADRMTELVITGQSTIKIESVPLSKQLDADTTP